MREKKYANILDDQEEIKTSEISNEEKLSMTRELKFKELQDAIDKDSELKEKAQEMKVYLHGMQHQNTLWKKWE